MYVYARPVPHLTIYVDRDLRERLSGLNINVSAACQAALRRKVRVAERVLAGDPGAIAAEAYTAARRERDKAS